MAEKQEVMTMDETVSVETIIRFGAICLGAFAVIFAVAVLTPWLAKHVDNWIANYRSNHDSRKDPSYGIRSIYELPPRKETPPPPEEPSDDTPASASESQ